MDRGDYEARALADSYKVIVDYGPNRERASDPDVYWRIKWKESDAVKTPQSETNECGHEFQSTDHTGQRERQGSEEKRYDDAAEYVST
jgi:hypothetical protein